MKLVLLLTVKIEQGMIVAQAWQDAGAPGVTFIRTHGLRSVQDRVRKGDVELPLVVTAVTTAMAHVLEQMEQTGLMLLSVVEDDMVPKLESAATAVLGDMRKPYQGFMIVLDVARAVGIYHHSAQDDD